MAEGTSPDVKKARGGTGSGLDKSREGWERSRTMVRLKLNRRSAQYGGEGGKGWRGGGQTGTRKGKDAGRERERREMKLAERKGWRGGKAHIDLTCLNKQAHKMKRPLK